MGKSYLRYTGDFRDREMNPVAEPEIPQWKVFYNGNFWGHHGRDRAGNEIVIGKQFAWADHQWLVPAAYSCSKGLVVDFCMRVEAEDIRAFMRKWNLSQENDSCDHFTQEQQMEMERENPMCLDFKPRLEMNGQILRTSHGCAVSYHPCLPAGMTNEPEAQWIVRHYELDTACGWVICRSAFPWLSRRRPEIKTLSLTMKQQPASIPGPRFQVSAPGDTVSFIRPANGKEYTLTVQETEQQTIPEGRFASERWEYPVHCCISRR